MNPKDFKIQFTNEDGYVRIDGRTYSTLDPAEVNLFQFMRGLEDAHRQLKSAQEVVNNMQAILDRHIQLKVLEEA